MLVLVGLLLVAPSVHGQEEPGDPREEEVEEDTVPPLLERETPSDTVDPVPVEPVVVSVLRSPVDLGEAPFSVSALGEESLQGIRSPLSVHESLRGLPGVQVQNRFNDAVGERLSVRGFGARSQFGIRGVKVLVDGIPATLPDGQSTLDHLDLGSVGRVEALRGPGSSLYGNAAGGVLSFESRRPADTSLRQELEWVSASDYHERIQSTSTGRLGDTGYLLNLSQYRNHGFRTNPHDPEGPPHGRAERRYLNSVVDHPVAEGQLRVIANFTDLDAESPGAIHARELAEGTRVASPLHVTQQSGREVRQGQLGMNWVGPVGERVAEVMLYGIDRQVHYRIPSSVVDLGRRAGGFRGMLRGDDDTDDGRLWWAVGVEFEGQFDDRTHHANHEGRPGTRTVNQKEQVVAGAAFAQLSLPINPVLGLMIGLRYDRINFLTDDRLGEGALAEGDLDAPTTTRTMDSASPSMGLNIDLHDGLGFYGNVATAFETPTTTELAIRPDGLRGLNPDLDPQIGFTAELGARGVLSDVAAYEVSYFHTTLQNELISFEMPGSPGRTFFRNAGSSVRNGVEVTVRLAPSSMLSALATYTYTDARFRDYEVGPNDFRGHRIPGLAPHRLHGALEVSPGPLYGMLSVEFVDAFPANDANTFDAIAPAYWRSDLRVGLDGVGVGQAFLIPYLAILNLTDEHYSTSVSVNALDGRFFEPGPGRRVQLGVRAGFGGR